MRSWILAAIAALGVTGFQMAAAEEGKDAKPEVVAGEVTKVDRERGRVTVRSADGKAYEFEASKETMRDLKEGDRIEAKQRKRDR
jgi:hypothetical protein